MKRTVLPTVGLAAMTDAERAVLAVLTESRTTSSVVRLSADLYGRDGNDERFTFGDPIGFVTWLLEGLNTQGYVTYRLTTRSDNDAPGFAGLPYYIRLTKKGWAAMGYVHYAIEVGTPSASVREVRGLDRTEYRTHKVIAEGGPLAHHWWWQCPTLFPSPKQKETLMTSQEMSMTRPYIKVTPEMEERVIASYARTGSYDKTSQETNVDARRVRYIVNDRPRLKRDSSSLKERALELIRANGPYVDVMALHRDMPGPHGLHNLVHILHSLNKAQLIEFRLDKSKSSGTNYLNIRARSTDGTDLSVSDTQDGTTNGAVPMAAFEVGPTSGPVGPTSDVGATESSSPIKGEDGLYFPELEKLVKAQRESSEGREKASKYIAAAEAIEDIDPNEAERLLRKAADIDGPVLSVVEKEYVRYAAMFPRPDAG